MKTKFHFSGYARAVLLSIIVAFAIESLIYADEVRASFHATSGGVRHMISRSQTSTPDWLRAPEAVAGALGRIWYWIK